MPPFVVSYLPPLRKILGKSQLSNNVLLLLSALIVVPAYIFSVNTENLLVKLRVVLSFYFEIVWESLQSFCLVLMINFDMNLIWLQIPLRLKILKISFKNVFIMKLPRTLSYNG